MLCHKDTVSYRAESICYCVISVCYQPTAGHAGPSRAGCNVLCRRRDRVPNMQGCQGWGLSLLSTWMTRAYLYLQSPLHLHGGPPPTLATPTSSPTPHFNPSCLAPAFSKNCQPICMTNRLLHSFEAFLRRKTKFGKMKENNFP